VRVMCHVDGVLGCVWEPFILNPRKCNDEHLSAAYSLSEVAPTFTAHSELRGGAVCKRFNYRWEECREGDRQTGSLPGNGGANNNV